MKEQPNWVTEYNYYSELNRKLNVALKLKFKVLPIETFANKNSEPQVDNSVQSFSAYRKRVCELTELVKHLIIGIETRGFNTHHIDHKVSIWHGFKNGIPAETIADISNLRMLSAKENMIKGRKCSY